jgi:hypothetical protein
MENLIPPDEGAYEPEMIDCAMCGCSYDKFDLVFLTAPNGDNFYVCGNEVVEFLNLK